MFDNKVGEDIYTKMQVGEPYRRYKKTILGKVFVFFLDPFTDKLNGLLLTGNPRKNDAGCFISTWSVKEDVFFKSNNPAHFASGRIKEVPIERKEVVDPNDISDEDIRKSLSSPFIAFKNTLNSIDDPDVMDRFLKIATEMEKTERWKSYIVARLSELQKVED